MKTIKKLEADGSKGDSYRNGYNQARKDVLKLIDERIKMLKEIMANSKQVNKSTGLMDVFKASVKELEELKTRITGK